MIDIKRIQEEYPDSAFLFIGLNQIVIIDKEDYQKLKRFSWRMDRKGYVRDGKNDFITYKILAKKEGYWVDHINGNPSDNRKCNLRYATPSQNQKNSKVRGKLKYKGVRSYISKKTGEPRYFVRVNDKSFGVYDDEDYAALIYNKYAKIEYGEFARLNLVQIKSDE